jgi:fumarate reductase flavoprotein subunit
MSLGFIPDQGVADAGPEKLPAAVSAWNGKEAAGKPDEFGRLHQNMKPNRDSPYCEIKAGPPIARIFCGLRVNHRLEVLDPDRRPIPGLSAAGLTAGRTNGEGVVNASVLSNLVLAFSAGWIAGDNATAPSPLLLTGRDGS